MVTAAEVEQKIIELLRSTPGLKTTQITKGTEARVSTIVERLKRLQAKGAVRQRKRVERVNITSLPVTGDEVDLIVPLPAATKSSAPWLRPIGDYGRDLEILSGSGGGCGSISRFVYP
jgi:hypothetical protein